MNLTITALLSESSEESDWFKRALRAALREDLDYVIDDAKRLSLTLEQLKMAPSQRKERRKKT